MNRILLAALVGTLTLSACDSNDPDPVAIQAQTATDINADVAERDPTTGVVAGTGRYALYDLNAGELVLGVNEADRADSLGTAWDIGFNGTTVIVNGGTSGPGQAQAQIVTTPFDALATAPETGYRTDGDAAADCPAVQAGPTTIPGTPRAVCTGSGNGWYTYIPFQTGGGYITPTAGRTLVVRNADGRTYSKVQFVSYYQGNPDISTITEDSVGRYFTFRYVTQPDGSRSFETTGD